MKKTIVQRIDALQAKLSRRTTELKTMQQELDDLKLLFVQGRERLGVSTPQFGVDMPDGNFQPMPDPYRVPPKITHAIVYDASQPPQDNDGAGTRHVICTDVPIQQGGCKGRAVSHEGAPICAGCGEDWPCSDSVAEAQVQADEEAERSLRARYNDLLVDHARLAAQVLRVRELRDRFATHEKSISYQAAATLLTRALDGDGPGCQGTPDKTESVVHAYEADTWRAPRLSTIGDDGGDA